MFTKKMITLVSLTISLSASLSFAGVEMPKRPANANPAQCLDLAIKTAKALDTITNRADADADVKAKSEVEYLDADMDYAQFLTYSFGDGESYLEVIIEANRYEKGDCSLQSASVMYQE